MIIEFCAAVVATVAIVKKQKKNKQAERDRLQQAGPYRYSQQQPDPYWQHQEPPPQPYSQQQMPPRKYGRRQEEFQDNPPPYTMEGPSYGQPGAAESYYNDPAYASRGMDQKNRRRFDGRQY